MTSLQVEGQDVRPEPPEERRKRLSRLLSRKTRRGVTASRMRPKARHLSPWSCKPATATPQNRFAGRRIGPSRLSGAGGQFRFRLAYGDPLGGKAVKPGGSYESEPVRAIREE